MAKGATYVSVAGALHDGAQWGGRSSLQSASFSQAPWQPAFSKYDSLDISSPSCSSDNVTWTLLPSSGEAEIPSVQAWGDLCDCFY